MTERKGFTGPLRLLEVMVYNLGQQTLGNIPAQRALVKIAEIIQDELSPALGLPSGDKSKLAEVKNVIDQYEKANAEKMGKGQSGRREIAPGLWAEDGTLYVDAAAYLAHAGVPVDDKGVKAIVEGVKQIAVEAAIPFQVVSKGE